MSYKYIPTPRRPASLVFTSFFFLSSSSSSSLSVFLFLFLLTLQRGTTCVEVIKLLCLGVSEERGRHFLTAHSSGVWASLWMYWGVILVFLILSVAQMLCDSVAVVILLDVASLRWDSVSWFTSWVPSNAFLFTFYLIHDSFFLMIPFISLSLFLNHHRENKKKTWRFKPHERKMVKKSKTRRKLKKLQS